MWPWLALPAAIQGAAAEESGGGASVLHLKRLSLEELAGFEVRSVDKRAEPLWQSPAAIQVLTAEDVGRSGATTIAESLRWVPGMQVARIDAHNWAISSRGFADTFSNKLLVLVDGRSVYTPLYSGVYWQYQDVVLEDLDRIEVIRGPGATLWGANAVNGVINVTTKSSSETQGLLVTGGGGNLETAFGTVRYGGRISDTATYRVYGKHASRDDFLRADGSGAHDRWEMSQGGIRVDWGMSLESELTLQSDVYGSRADQDFVLATLDGPDFRRESRERVDVVGGNVLGRWTRRTGAESEIVVQTYYDRMKQEASYYEFDVGTFDLDFQHSIALASWNDVVWGVNSRWIRDETRPSFQLAVEPESRSYDLLSAFVQDRIELIAERLELTAGTKLEYNDYSRFEYQPGARLAWMPDESQTLWGSVSRAVRTPSRLEHDLISHSRTLASGLPGAPPSVVTLVGDDRFGSEKLVAYELGYRVRPRDWVSIEVALFYNVYDELRTIETGGPEFATLPRFVTVPVRPSNAASGESYGGEVSISIQATEGWRVRAGYGLLRLELEREAWSTDTSAEDAEGASPRHQVFLVSQWELGRSFSFDAGLRFVDRLPAQAIPAYLEADLRIAWRPRPNWEIAVVGQNLLDDRHPEFGGSSLNNSGASEVPRGVYAKISWRH